MVKILPPVIRAAAKASSYQSDQIAVSDVVEKTKYLGEMYHMYHSVVW